VLARATRLRTANSIGPVHTQRRPAAGLGRTVFVAGAGGAIGDRAGAAHALSLLARRDRGDDAAISGSTIAVGGALGNPTTPRALPHGGAPAAREGRPRGAGHRPRRKQNTALPKKR